MWNTKKGKLFFKLHWIKIIVAVLLSVLATSLVMFIHSGLNEWGSVDAISKQRTIAGMPFQFYMMVVTGIVQAVFFGIMWFFIMRGGGITSLTQARQSAIKGEQIGVRWSDVIGMEEAKKEAMEVVQLIRIENA